MPVTGDKEVAAVFRALAKAPTAAVRRKARQDALKPVKESARAKLYSNGSVETAALATALIVSENLKNKDSSIVAVKRGKRGKKNRNPVRYAHLVEWGTAPHWQPNRFGGIMHPGARPFPFMRPALEQHRDSAAKAYFVNIWTAIVKSVK